jgi:hypothetical protein
LVARKYASIGPNDVPLSTLIEQNSDPIDVNFVSRSNFNNNAYRGNFNSRPFPGNSSNSFGNPYGNSYHNNHRVPSDLESSIKEFINAQKVFNTLIEEKLNKLDDMSKSIDRISLDVENLKAKSLPPRVDINESIKSMYVSIDESKKRTSTLNAKRELLEKSSLTNF